MEITILEDRPNPLMKRHEYRFEVSHATAATPSRDAVRGELSKVVKAPKDRVIIERMGALYGTATSRGEAMVYETADAAKSIPREHILVRNGLKEKAGKDAGAPAKSEPPAGSAAPAPEAPKPAAAAEAPAAKPESKPESKPEPKSETKTEPKAEAKPHKAKAPKGEKAPAAEGG